MSLKLRVLSPEAEVLHRQVTRVTLPTVSGQITVLPHHIPLFTQISSGELRAQDIEGKSISLAVGGGFANIRADQVTVLADFGVDTELLDEAQIRAAKERAEKLLATLADEKSSALAQSDLAKSLLQLKIISQRRRR